jgi:hypothetical protein
MSFELSLLCLTTQVKNEGCGEGRDKCAYTFIAVSVYADEVPHSEEIVAQPAVLWAKPATAVGLGSW